MPPSPGCESSTSSESLSSSVTLRPCCRELSLHKLLYAQSCNTSTLAMSRIALARKPAATSRRRFQAAYGNERSNSADRLASRSWNPSRRRPHSADSRLAASRLPGGSCGPAVLRHPWRLGSAMHAEIYLADSWKWLAELRTVGRPTLFRYPSTLVSLRRTAHA